MDKQLEAALDEAGRDKVFALMRASGWKGTDAPPKWVWWQAIGQVRAQHTGQPVKPGA